MTFPLPKDLVASALECSPDSLTSASGLARHPNWDSFGHLKIMMALEEHYGVPITDGTIRAHETFAAIQATYEALQKT
jgi:acyl carrier protein